MELQRDVKPEEGPAGHSAPSENEGTPKRTRQSAPGGGIEGLTRGPGSVPDAGDMSREEYEKLLDMYDVSFSNFAEGEVVRGKVLRVLPGEVIVDVGYKSEGLIDIEEFTDPAGEVHVAVGDTVDVLLEKTENKEGYVVLSKEKAEKMKVWEEVERAYNTGQVDYRPRHRARSRAVSPSTSACAPSFPAAWWTSVPSGTSTRCAARSSACA